MTSLFLGSCLLASLASCREQRIEYHNRPAFYEMASKEKLPDEVTLDDGTIIRYRSAQATGIRGLTDQPGGKPFEIREEKADGTIVLHAMLPEHVLVNTLTCVRNEEYQLLFEQMLAARTKHAYEQAGQGVDEFTDFFRKNRHDLAATLTRMVAGLSSQEVSITHLDDEVTQCRLRPQIAQPYKFTAVDIIQEADGLKLLMIH